jgi:hypothetical protein
MAVYEIPIMTTSSEEFSAPAAACNQRKIQVRLLLRVRYWTLISYLLFMIPNFTTASLNNLSEKIHSIAKQLALDPNQPSLWKQLGKIQLDDGEFAEARRIFCFGASCCPNDLELQHHMKVFEAFHGSRDDSSTSMDDDIQKQPDNPDLIFSIDLPPSEIPESILKHPGSLPPHQRTKLIHATTEPILTKQQCHRIIEAASRTTELRGWTKDRHVQAPTCDIPVFDLDVPIQRWIRSYFHTVLFPFISRAFGNQLEIDPTTLRIQDCFVVRYDANDSSGPGFSQLKPHHDESLISLTIALNEMGEDYQDGGLFIAPTGDVLNGPAGTVMCFAGGVLHGGYPLLSGTRWILTVFCYIDMNQSKKSPGYTLQAIQELSKQS